MGTKFLSIIFIHLFGLVEAGYLLVSKPEVPAVKQLIILLLSYAKHDQVPITVGIWLFVFK